MNEAEIKGGKYRCALCQGDYTRKRVAVDHISPVVGVGGFTSWDEYYERLFCGKENLQVACKLCHGKKTKQENAERRKLK